MTIDELIQRLEEYRDALGGDAEVRLMTQQQLALRERPFTALLPARRSTRRTKTTTTTRSPTTWSTSARAANWDTERSGPGRSPTEAETPPREASRRVVPAA